MLTIIHTTHSCNPWRLAWNAMPLADVSFPRKREAMAVLGLLLPLTDWSQHPDSWDPATRAAVRVVIDAIPSVREMTALRLERRSPR